ncbi:hypothetical protein CAPTEDRAFT_203549 [Capitella teleta]|uniref:DUF3504 domain-containing protein n=1 Tax=Capitella teleta TaxID=283909 RepID=R7UL80_CAPTE|nr:hypothetical protein CAPTEDRAFT_203549 [Capitella teleta]|eukprot:ELU06980.1 hypothetical protein CAPTEDRAFT_203549 [Capitella teleta]
MAAHNDNETLISTLQTAVPLLCKNSLPSEAQGLSAPVINIAPLVEREDGGNEELIDSTCAQIREGVIKTEVTDDSIDDPKREEVTDLRSGDLCVDCREELIYNSSLPPTPLTFEPVGEVTPSVTSDPDTLQALEKIAELPDGKYDWSSWLISLHSRVQEPLDDKVRHLHTWFQALGEIRQMEDIPPKELDDLLSTYFAKGKDYSPISHILKFALVNCYLKQKNYDCNLALDLRFKNCRDILRALCVGVSQKTTQPLEIQDSLKPEELKQFTEEDVERMYSMGVLGADFLLKGDPNTMILTLWFILSVHFGLEYSDHECLTWGDIQLKSDSNARSYLEYVKNNKTTDRPRIMEEEDRAKG